MAGKRTKEMWQGVGGCGCLAILAAIFFPPLWPALGIFFFIWLIVAIFKSPFSLYGDHKEKRVARKFEDALKKENPQLLDEELDDED